MKPSYAVAHLRMHYDETPLATGSGVLFRCGDVTYIVTAWHNVTGRHSTTLELLDKKRGSVPNNIIASICLLFTDNQGQQHTNRVPFSIPLEDDASTYYLVHSQSWPRVDVVAIPIDLDREYECQYYDIEGKRLATKMRMRQPASIHCAASDVVAIQDLEASGHWIPANLRDELAAGDDLFVLGYPRAITDATGQPLWKRATVATDPDFRWQQQEAFLVDCASREGMSGAPVISYKRSGNTHVAGTTFHSNGPLTVFHGIYVSRLEVGNEFEAHIGTVWRPSTVEEIITSGRTAPQSNGLVATTQEIDRAIAASWPTQNSDEYAVKLLGGGHLLDFFTHTYVMKELGGRANPAEVRSRIKEAAQQRQLDSSAVDLTRYSGDERV